MNKKGLISILLNSIIHIWVLAGLFVSCSNDDDDKAEGMYEYNDIRRSIYSSYYYHETDSISEVTKYYFFFSTELCTPDAIHFTDGISDGVESICLSIDSNSFGQDLTDESNPNKWMFYYTGNLEYMTEGTIFVNQSEDNPNMFDITFEITFEDEKQISGSFHGTCLSYESNFLPFIK